MALSAADISLIRFEVATLRKILPKWDGVLGREDAKWASRILADADKAGIDTSDIRFESKSGQAFGGTPATWRNKASYARAVNPKQIDEAREFDKAHGVPTRYLKTGEPVMDDLSHARRYDKIHKFQDLSEGHADAAARAIKTGRVASYAR